MGEQIRMLRRNRDMQQTDLASALGVKQSTISDWENNVSFPCTENLIALAAFFAVSLDELVANVPQPEAPQPKA